MQNDTLHMHHTLGTFLYRYYTITMMWNSLCEVGWQSGQLIKTPFSFAIGTLTWTLIMLVSQPCHSFHIKKSLGPHVCTMYMYLGWNVGLSLIQCVKKISNTQSSWNKSFHSIFLKPPINYKSKHWLTARKLIAQKAVSISYNGSRGLSSTVTPRGLKKYNRIPTNAIGTKVQVKHVIHPK